MVAINVDGLSQIGGHNSLADIEHGIPHLLNTMDQEQPRHQVFRMFPALQSRGVFFYQFFAGLVQARLDLADPEGQPGVVSMDRLFNPVKPAG